MIATFKIGFYEPFTGIWVKGEKEFCVDGWHDMMNTKIRWKKTLAAKYDENIEVECEEK